MGGAATLAKRRVIRIFGLTLALGLTPIVSARSAQSNSEDRTEWSLERSGGGFSNRDLASYDKYFHQATQPCLFSDYLKRLGPTQVWLDSGAGDGIAIREALMSPSFRASMVGLNYQSKWLFTEAERKNSRLRLLDGSTLQQFYHRGSLLNGNQPTFDLITDLFGPATYSENLHEVIQIYGNALKTGGHLLFLLTPVHFTREGHTSWTTEFEVSEKVGISLGPNLKRLQARLMATSFQNLQHDSPEFRLRVLENLAILYTWLNRSQGFDLLSFSKVGWIDSEGAAILLRRNSQPIRLPELKVMQYDAETQRPPPRRGIGSKSETIGSPRYQEC